MGDVAMTVPVLMTLLRQYPGLELTVLSREFFRPVFDGIPRLNFYAADVRGRHKGIRGLYRLYRELKKTGIGAVADLHHVLRSNMLRIFFRMSGFPVVQIDKGRKEKKALTRSRNKVLKPLKTTHQRYADVFGKLGYSIDMEHPVFRPKEPLGETVITATGLDAEKTEQGKLIGIAPFAAFGGKRYPPDLMEKVIAGLDRDGYNILLFGGGEEEIRVLGLLEGRYRNVTSVAGKLSFREELQLISNLDVMVAMDSGNAHLAAMYGVKTITLWGVTHPYAGFYPIGQPKANALLSDREKYPLIPTSVYGKTVPEGYEEVMQTIDPESVSRKIRELV
ncbi:ADP-heptose--LPS heptosyltransferase RfaF [Sinomicrobium soli]|nr:ADP-heptose--LPS heptosyltransferase RfaF [Sinomicrobium sp. N-1-3-6]